jgi:hypothetical protein
MTAPPGVSVDTGFGGSTAPSKSELINAAHLILDNCAITFGARRINRMVEHFKARAPRADGHVFFQYLANAVQMTAAEQRRALLNPDIARAISYADPTGETAVNNVLRAVRRG